MVKYDSYKDSGVEWIGEIPIHWDISKIKYENNVISSNIDKKEYEGFNKYNIIHYNDVVKYQQIFKNNISDFGYCSESQYESFKVKKHDIILTKDSMDISNICDSSIVLDEPDKCVFGYHLTKLTTESDLILPFFEFLFINNPKIKEYFLISSNGTTIIGVSKATIENTSILIPSLPEQHQIVEFLNEKTSIIDDLIQKKLRKIELLKEQRTSLINHTVTKGLNPYVKMKDSGVEWIGEIPIHWERKKLGYLVNLQGRIGFKGYKKTDFVDEGEGCLVIGGKHIDNNNKINFSNPDYLHWDKYYESPEIMVFKGDLIVSQRGTLGKVLMIEDDYGPLTINPSLVVVNQIKENTKFLWYSLQSDFIMKTIDILGSVTTIPMLSQEEISSFPIFVPPQSEQQQIVDYLDKQTQINDTTITKEQKRIELLKEYRQSLISNVVTGKIKVTIDE